MKFNGIQESSRIVIKRCLINGEVFEYDQCFDERIQMPNRWCIGQGVIYSINGIKHTDLKIGDMPTKDTDLYYFYVWDRTENFNVIRVSTKGI